MRKVIISVGKKTRFILMPAFLVCLFLCPFAERALSAEDSYAGLKQKLIQDGFSRQQVSKTFQPAPSIMYKLVSGTFKIHESQLSYDKFLDPSEISKARQFILLHQSSFKKAEGAYGVESGVIAAILLVETHFGSFTGKTPTLAVFSTFAVMDQRTNRDKVWRLLAPQDRERVGREAFDKKLLDRSVWAYKELSALLELGNSQGLRVDSFKGSYMGAVGWPQFLPSSLVKYGADGNGDGRIDLYNAEDAIFSTANYLKEHGWCQAKFPADQEQVIWQYNHSKPYVRTILGIAERVKGSAGL